MKHGADDDQLTGGVNRRSVAASTDLGSTGGSRLAHVTVGATMSGANPTPAGMAPAGVATATGHGQG